MRLRELDLLPDGDDLWVSFRFGHGDGFDSALDLLKQIPLGDREYSPEHGHRWSVRLTPLSRAIMGDAFENFEHEFDILESQGSLF